MLGMLIHVFLRTVPERRNRLHVFVEAEHETILLLVICHVLERVVGDVAVQLNTWLNAPVPFIVLHNFLAEEEARLESTHMPIALRVSIDDLSMCHIFSDSGGLFLVDEVGI